MKFIPILYSADMVQALLDKRKTMTRRTKGLEKVNGNSDDWKKKYFPGKRDWER